MHFKSTQEMLQYYSTKPVEPEKYVEPKKAPVEEQEAHVELEQAEKQRARRGRK